LPIVTPNFQGRAIAGRTTVRSSHPLLPAWTSDPTVRAARADETAQILGLIAASYDRDDSPARLEYWRWKHEQNPFGVSPCLVAESNGRLVGVRVFLRWNWQSGAQSVRAVRAVDTATLPEWRGKGVFSRLTMRLVEQVQIEGVSFVYNTPNDKSMPGYLKMGWAPVTRVPLWTRPVRLSDVVRRAFTELPAQPPTLRTFATAAEVLQDRRLVAFLADVSTDDERYHTARTLQYLRWRYANVPGMHYQARLDIAGDAGALLIARGRLRGRFREITISELLVTPSLRGVQIARALISDLIRNADADYVAACAAGGTPERSALARSGFLPIAGIGPHFTARALRSDGRDPSRWANWRCSIGDLELF
jgi:GNAT superfamily N-acetyltransferase